MFGQIRHKFLKFHVMRLDVFSTSLSICDELSDNHKKYIPYQQVHLLSCANLIDVTEYWSKEGLGLGVALINSYMFEIN